jgi:iron complex outermembrane receptor protein
MFVLLRPYTAGLLLILSSCAALAQSEQPEQPEPSDVTDVDFNDVGYPVVITPTRLRQPLSDVPASITVITAETMRRHGITRVEEALRLVPGMHVDHALGNEYLINYHGTRKITPRRLNVLIDGVSAYLPAFSQMEWSLLPVSIEDIDRIEVIRGPDSASYGPNSMMAVINILTKHPKDVERAMVAMGGDNRKMGEMTVRLATTIGGTSVRVTAEVHHDPGFDRVGRVAAHDGTRMNQIAMRAEHELADGSSLRFGATAMAGKLERPLQLAPGLGTSEDTSSMINSSLLSARWTKALSSTHELQVGVFHGRTTSQQDLNACISPVTLWRESNALYNLNPRLGRHVGEMLLGLRADAPTGLTSAEQAAFDAFFTRLSGSGTTAFFPLVCGTANQDGTESRSQLEVQSTYVASDNLRFVGGLGWRAQSATSKTYFNGTVDNTVSWLFGHVEYRPMKWLTANFGGYGEHNSLSGPTFAPRMAFNFQLAEGHTLRAVMSKGLRTPDIFEEKANWRYTLNNLSRPIDNANSADIFLKAQSPGGLSSEKIWSRELGYLMLHKRSGLSLDVRVFDERLSDLISKTLSAQDFTPDNSGTVHLTGAEMQAQWDISARWSAWMQYGYLVNSEANLPDERAQYAQHSGALGLSWLVTDAWRASLAHYGHTGDGIHEVGYARTDLTLNHDFSVSARAAQASLTLSQFHTPKTKTYGAVDRFYTSGYDSRIGVMARVRVAF